MVKDEEKIIVIVCRNFLFVLLFLSVFFNYRGVVNVFVVVEEFYEILFFGGIVLVFELFVYKIVGFKKL